MSEDRKPDVIVLLENGQSIINPTSVPDRLFRGAWRLEGDVIGVNMTKARLLAKQKVRETRAGKLVELDGQWMRAAGRGENANATAVEAKRETLRTLPQRADFDAAADPAALKSVVTTITAEIESL